MAVVVASSAIVVATFCIQTARMSRGYACCAQGTQCHHTDRESHIGGCCAKLDRLVETRFCKPSFGLLPVHEPKTPMHSSIVAQPFCGQRQRIPLTMPSRSLYVLGRFQSELTMQFVHHDLGQRQRGEIVEITLSGNAANVRLLDSSNFSNYKNGRRHTFYGGLAKKSPVRLQIPSSGRWHVAVDMQGMSGNVRSSARVLPGRLPTMSERPLADIPSLIRTPDELPIRPGPSGRIHDVFISHASEDKDEIVRPLAAALQGGGLDVWYDEFTLKIGDSLRQKIDAGLANSRFGIVVLSHAFIKKGWTNYELDGIVSRSVNGEQVMLPIWHGVTKQEVLNYSPSLADKVARNTASYTLEEIASEIIDLIQDKL